MNQAEALKGIDAELLARVAKLGAKPGTNIDALLERLRGSYRADFRSIATWYDNTRAAMI